MLVKIAAEATYTLWYEFIFLSNLVTHLHIDFLYAQSMSQ